MKREDGWECSGVGTIREGVIRVKRGTPRTLISKNLAGIRVTGVR